MSNPVTDEVAADHLSGGHPKSKRAPLRDPAPVLPGSPGNGAAPGANGPPTTGAPEPGGSLTLA